MELLESALSVSISDLQSSNSHTKWWSILTIMIFSHILKMISQAKCLDTWMRHADIFAILKCHCCHKIMVIRSEMQACLYSWEHKVPLIAFSQDRCLTLFSHPLVDSLHTVYHEPKVHSFTLVTVLLILPEQLFHIYAWFIRRIFTGRGHAFSWASFGCCWCTGISTNMDSLCTLKYQKWYSMDVLYYQRSGILL